MHPSFVFLATAAVLLLSICVVGEHWACDPSNANNCLHSSNSGGGGYHTKQECIQKCCGKIHKGTACTGGSKNITKCFPDTEGEGDVHCCLNQTSSEVNLCSECELCLEGKCFQTPFLACGKKIFCSATVPCDCVCKKVGKYSKCVRTCESPFREAGCDCRLCRKYWKEQGYTDDQIEKEGLCSVPERDCCMCNVDEDPLRDCDRQVESGIFF